MIKLLRIDERLVHGQVAVVWSKFLNVDRIIVADDEASKSEMQKYAMNMAMPESIKLAVVTVEKAIRLLKDPRSEKLSILLIVRNPKNALTILNNVDNVPEINIGNYGRMTEESEKKISIASNLYIHESEIDDLKKLTQFNIEVNYQSVPNEKKLPLISLLERRENR